MTYHDDDNHVDKDDLAEHDDRDDRHDHDEHLDHNDHLNHIDQKKVGPEEGAFVFLIIPLNQVLQCVAFFGGLSLCTYSPQLSMLVTD